MTTTDEKLVRLQKKEKEAAMKAAEAEKKAAKAEQKNAAVNMGKSQTAQPDSGFTLL